MKRTLAALTALYALPVAADEVWSTPAGQIVYETVLDGGMAVFSMPAQPLMYDATAGATGWVYIPDLANADGVRSFHEAFWIVEGMQYCPMAMVAPDGRKSFAWGRALIAFDAPSFPSGFTMITGLCAYEPFLPIRAEPVLGD
jgi:hypothetical protein